MSWDWSFIMAPAERKRRAEEAQQSGNANGRNAETNGGPTVSFAALYFMLSLSGVMNSFFPRVMDSYTIEFFELCYTANCIMRAALLPTRKPECSRGGGSPEQYTFYSEFAPPDNQYDATSALPTIPRFQGSPNDRSQARYCLCRVWRWCAVQYGHGGTSRLQNHSPEPHGHSLCQEVTIAFFLGGK